MPRQSERMASARRASCIVAKGKSSDLVGTKGQSRISRTVRSIPQSSDYKQETEEDDLSRFRSSCARACDKTRNYMN